MDSEKSSQVVYIPECNPEIRPFVGQICSSLDEAIGFYRNYASECGFGTRRNASKSVDNTFTWVYVVCSREGKKRYNELDPINAREGFVNKRRRSSKRCECNARISFKFVSVNCHSEYVTHQFVEEHNHPMVENQHKRFMSINRNIDELHQKFILDCANANIGPILTFNLLKEMLGGYDGVGCTVVEVRNYTRDMKAYVEGSDAQMLLNEMSRKKETSGGFTYDFELDNENKLKHIFWCDATSKRNFHMFGDVVAFDSTYNTNRYCIIFAPFTRKDNHGRPVTFGSGLVSKEDADTFSWLFTKFVQCMGAKPKLIITDQDLGMKVAVERVLVGTRHRWCMWHIMLKLAEKISKELLGNEDMKKELKSCVWSDLIEADEFEVRWNDIMVRFGLDKVEWFKSMYGLREFWVLAFFRDFPMGSMLRTTSVSESENSFFKRFMKHRCNLVEFMMNFNHAIDSQRNVNAKLDYMDSTIVPILATDMPIEKHASTIFTDRMFKDVQGEIVEACYNCSVVEMSLGEYCEIYKIKDNTGKTWSLSYRVQDEVYDCGCKLFGRMGILCSHIFFVFKNKGLKLIPEKYCKSRWLKTALLNTFHWESSSVSTEHSSTDDKCKAMNKLYASFFGLVQKVQGNIDHISLLTSAIDDAGVKIFGEGVVLSISQKKQMIEEFYGGRKPDVIDVHPPAIVKTKGSGSRLISRKEKVVREMNKPTRRCAKCGELGHYDARNCDKIKEKNKQKYPIDEDCFLILFISFV